MKKVFLTLLFCSFMAQCSALTPMTDENMMKAIQYGVASKQDKQTLYQLTNPWLIPERSFRICWPRFMPGIRWKTRGCRNWQKSERRFRSMRVLP